MAQQQLDVGGVADDGTGYSGRQAADIAGISYRQLDYWARTGLVLPSLAQATGSGSRRRYAYRDLLELRVVRQLLEAGIKLQTVRQVFGYLREHLDGDVASANLVINGPRSVLVRTGGELIDLVAQGQGVLNVLALAGVKRDVDAAILAFPRRDGADAGAGADGATSTDEAAAADR